MPESASSVSAAAETPDLPARLLAWYDRHARRLPWRALPGETQDPYRVWLSEIMLQQTTVAAVAPYFEDFTSRWPRVEDLAAAELDAVLTAWAGLGYYARARNLHRCAREVAETHGGRFPDSEEGLRSLPGIGPYTAAAVAAIAFGRTASPVDGNIERVIARLFSVETPFPAAKPEIKRLAESLTPEVRTGDYVQAMMDLGATICTPRRVGLAARFALRGSSSAKPSARAWQSPDSGQARHFGRRGVAFWLWDGEGGVLLRRRPEEGLLGGMMEVPSTPWREEAWPGGEAESHAPASTAWRDSGATVRHTFTHFHLELDLWIGEGAGRQSEGVWVPVEELGQWALPSVMRKVVRSALAASQDGPEGTAP